ncbi:uncharacterized protein LOC116302592 [Actinia tenebrosa]|uniref:Uncharacterized protein LOC116302592 n=1 Tax=Actinia tenebrosa TaxID=6105 RepID=A0A6P8IMI8_ACTTE|nr:uncharacterized protein LOC116302592 [Actinia tenebrosa]
MAFLIKSSLVAVLVFVLVYPQQADAEEPIGLKLSSFGPNHIQGEYRYTESFGLQFNIRQGFMEMKTLNGNETITMYMKLPRDTVYFQIGNSGFLSHLNKEALVPAEVPRTFKALMRFAAERFSTSPNGFSDEDTTLKEAHKQALETIREMEETRLLEICSKALAQAGGSGLTMEITQPYHLMSLNLLLALDRAGKPVDVIKPPGTQDEESTHRSKRCSNLRSDPNNDDCYGMCGRKCNCWSSVCGDCCYHQGCAEHDYCCGKNFWSRYCLFPFRYKFTCSSYGGYSSC